MKSEDAVAPVIAAMLVLAVIVTFLAVWNATAIPAMKEQAEVSHLHDVEEGILRFSSDVETAASSSSGVTLSERIPLGGGDILYSPAKSGGTLAVEREEPYLGIRLYNATSRVENSAFVLSDVTYLPVGNFWQDQGYVWSHGYTNVTKGRVSVPLEYYTEQNVSYPIAGALFSASVGAYGSTPGTCSAVVIKTVNVSPSQTGSVTSGNGIGTLSLNSTLYSEKISNVTEIRVNTSLFAAPPDPGFAGAMHDAVNRSFANNIEPICSNILYDPAQSSDRTVTITVVDPLSNITVIRQTAEITISAQ